jgi:regulator of ribonuclease activity A
MTVFATATLCDSHAKDDHFQIADPLFKMYGGNMCFSGQISTLKTFEDSGQVEAVLQEKVASRILVVDGGGSHRCALVDYELARLAVSNGWQGIVIYGCVRHTDLLASLPIGIRALHSHPLQGHKRDHGERDLSVTFAGVNFKKDHFLYADADGIIVSDKLL